MAVRGKCVGLTEAIEITGVTYQTIAWAVGQGHIIKAGRNRYLKKSCLAYAERRRLEAERRADPGFRARAERRKAIAEKMWYPRLVAKWEEPGV